MSVSEDVKRKAYNICRQFLGGCWKNLTYDDFAISHISGGLSNFLYQCEISNPKIETVHQEPRKILLRIYGSIIQEHPDTVVTDSVIYALLAEKKLGPKLYGVFPGGRVEEYLETRHVRQCELWLPNISKDCARIMAKFHHMTMPLCKEPTWLHDTMDRYLKSSLDMLACRHEFEQSKRNVLDQIAKLNIESELAVMRQLLSQVHSPIVFCHNDLQGGNVLLKPEGCPLGGSSSVLAIDYEYSSYNFRGFDIGNHFAEWCYNYHEVDDFPYFSADLDKFPNRDQQLLFIRTYISESGLDQKPGFIAADMEEHLLLEATVYTLASHYFWALWSVVQAKKSDIKFGYLEYAVVRFEGYFTQKKKLPQHIVDSSLSAGKTAGAGDPGVRDN